MIRVLLVQDAIAWQVAKHVEVPWTGSETAARLALAHALPDWGEKPRLRIAIQGRTLAEDELCLPLADEVELLVGPDPEGLELLVMIALSLVSMAVSFLSAKLIDLPSDVLTDEQRGDQSSATNAWDRIHTEYRPGFPVPFALGEVDVGGTAVHIDVQAGVGGSATGPNEELRLAVALCEGPIRAIGGVAENADDLGALEGQLHASPAPTQMLPIPADIRVDGNRLDPGRTGTLSGTPARWSDTPNARVYTRLGRIPQDPLPAIGPRWGYQAFSGARQTDLVDADLATQGATAIHTIVATEPIDFVSLILSFPAGLYDSSNGALPPQSASVRLQIRWRRVGTTSWSLPLVRTITEANLNTFTVTETIHVQTTGPIEIETTRQTAPGGRGVADRLRLRQAVYGFGTRFAYPRTATLGLVLVNGENASGSRAQIVTRVQGLLVRVWDATLNSGQPSSASYWEVPASGDTYHGIWSYPPGRNPAWVLLAFLLHPGGAGRWVSTSQIDWQAFRNWADFCDQSIDVDGEPEALCQCDLVVDSPTPISEVVDRICQAGRASIRRIGNQISVVYQFRDAHGRGTNAVAAKTRTQLISTANVNGFGVEYLDTFNRPSTILATFRDRERDFAWRTVPVHDPRGGHQDPATVRPIQYRRQAVRFESISRESQVIREAQMLHAANALVRSEISGTLGREALAALPGDWFGVVHDVLRPYDTECFALRTTAASSAGASIALNKALVLSSGRTYQVVVRQADGTLAERTVTSISGSYAAGATLTLNAAITCAKSAPVAFGEIDKVVVDYELRTISLDAELRRVFRATEVAPDIHDTADVGDLLAAAGAALGGVQSGLPRAYALLDDTSSLVATEIVVRTLRGRQACEISWRRPEGMGAVRARVHVRLSGSERWWSAGETDGDRVTVRLALAETYDVSVTMADRLGRWQRPGSGAVTTVRTEEFPASPPADVSGLQAAWDGRELLFTWDAQADADHYEIRNVGGDWQSWLAAPVLARSSEARAALHIPGIFASGDELVFGVRAVSPDGLLSARPALLTWTAADPTGLWEIDVGDPDPEDGGFSRSNCTCTLFDDFSITVPPADVDRAATGGGRGTAESQVWDAGFDVDAWVTISWEARLRALEPVSSATHRLDSGEAHWRLVDGRPASERAPAIDPQRLVSELTELLEDLAPGARCGAAAGEAGVRGEVRVFLRTARSGETISAQPWVRCNESVRLVHRYAQLRVELDWQNDGSTALDVRRLRMRRYA